MKLKLLITIIISLLVIGGGVVVIQRQQQTEPQKQGRLNQVEPQDQKAEPKPADNYHEARKKVGQFLVPDTKSRMRFGEDANSTPTPGEPTQ